MHGLPGLILQLANQIKQLEASARPTPIDTAPCSSQRDDAVTQTLEAFDHATMFKAKATCEANTQAGSSWCAHGEASTATQTLTDTITLNDGKPRWIDLASDEESELRKVGGDDACEKGRIEAADIDVSSTAGRAHVSTHCFSNGLCAELQVHAADPSFTAFVTADAPSLVMGPNVGRVCDPKKNDQKNIEGATLVSIKKTEKEAEKLQNAHLDDHESGHVPADGSAVL